MPSRSPAVEKLQQLPQYAWFFTTVTAPSARQSKLSGCSPIEYSPNAACRWHAAQSSAETHETSPG